jgi:hypothetical protein
MGGEEQYHCLQEDWEAWEFSFEYSINPEKHRTDLDSLHVDVESQPQE